MVEKKNILVTGASGQLGRSLRDVSLNSSHNFLFKNRSEFDITNFALIEDFLENFKINSIINCAAFTNVEKSEICKGLAEKINHIAVDNLAKLCHTNGIQLIHISTDYVFDGNSTKHYVENDKTNPVNFYGFTKKLGENKILNYKIKDSAIIRTSFLYSKYNDNFAKRIIRQINEGKNFSVVDKLNSSPTNASDLSNIILEMIDKLKNNNTEVFHYSNTGSCSRYEFANQINNLLCGNSVIYPSENIIGNAKRPLFSVLNSVKIHNMLNLKPKSWQDSLDEFINDYKN